MMSRVLVVLGLLVVAAAVGWALWEKPGPPRPAAPVSHVDTAPATETPPPRSVAPAPETEALPPPRRVAVTTAVPPPPAAVLNPPIPQDRAGVRRLTALEAPPPPGVGDGMNADTPPPEPGAMRREAVREAVLQAKPVIAGCYEQTLARNPQAAGMVKVQFVLVAKDGVARLRDAEITEDTLGDPFLGMCALKALADLTFEAEADGEVTVNYPFILKPTEDEAEETP